MPKPSPQTSKFLTTLLLTLFMFLAFVLSGFSVANSDQTAGHELPPAQGPTGQPAPRLNNVIQNGDFEINPRSDVAADWQPYQNGLAHYSWYDEQWEEAVHSGQHSQLMEIFQVEGNEPHRVMAIYQTVQVVPNANYHLTIHALMRSDAPAPLRNQGDYAMAWGIDYRGEGNYSNVENWVTMPLTEQIRLGSAARDRTEANHLFFEQFTATIYTTNTNRLTLFIRGEKIQPTGTEVNFDVDDVSLIGPYPVSQPTPAAVIPPVEITTTTPTPLIPAPTPASIPVTGGRAAPAGRDYHLPDAGAVLPENLPAGALLLAGLVLIVLGARGADDLLRRE